MAKFGKSRFPKSYQTKVGFGARELLHKNLKELVQILNNNNVITNGMSVFEMGAAGARNLYYIWEQNNSVKLYANDLFETESKQQMHDDIRDIINFYEGDSEDVFDECRVDGLDLLLVSDHFMHLEYKKADNIIKNVMSKWMPEYILLREVKKEFEKPEHPKLFHNYDQLLKDYNLISNTTSEHAVCFSYFIWLLKRK